jgi:hypothetical protein
MGSVKHHNQNDDDGASSFAGLASPALSAHAIAQGAKRFGLAPTPLARGRTAPSGGDASSSDPASLMSPIRLEQFQGSGAAVPAMGLNDPMLGSPGGRSRFFDNLSVAIPPGQHAARGTPATSAMSREPAGSPAPSPPHVGPGDAVSKKLFFQSSPAASPQQGQDSESFAGAAAQGGRRLLYNDYAAGSPDAAASMDVDHDEDEEEAAAAAAADTGSMSKKARKEAKKARKEARAAARAAAAAAAAAGESASSSDEELPADIPAHMLSLSKGALLKAIQKVDEALNDAEARKERLAAEVEDAARLAAKQAKLREEQEQRERKAREDKERAAEEERARIALLNEEEAKEAAAKAAREAAEAEEAAKKAAAEAALVSPAPSASAALLESTQPARAEVLAAHVRHRLSLWFRSPSLSAALQSVTPYRVLRENHARAAQAHEYVEGSLYPPQLVVEAKKAITVEKNALASRHRPHLLPVNVAAEKKRRLQQEQQWVSLVRAQNVEALLVARVEVDERGMASVSLRPVASPPLAASNASSEAMADVVVAAPSSPVSVVPVEPSAPFPTWLAHELSSSSGVASGRAPSTRRSLLAPGSGSGSGSHRVKSKALAGGNEQSKSAVVAAMHARIKSMQVAMKAASSGSLLSGYAGVEMEQLTNELLKLTQPTSTKEDDDDGMPEDALDLFWQEDAARSLASSTTEENVPSAPLYNEPRESLLYQENRRSFPLMRTRVAAVLMARKRAQHAHLLRLVHTYKNLERKWHERQHAMQMQQQMQQQLGHLSAKQLQDMYGAPSDGRRSSLRNRQVSDGLNTPSDPAQLQASLSYYSSGMASPPPGLSSLSGSLTSSTSSTSSTAAPALAPLNLATAVSIPASTLPPDEEQKRIRYLKCTATLPDLLVDPRERSARAWDSRNGLIVDALASERAYKNKNPWTEHEKRIFEKKFVAHPKQFRKIAAFLPNKNVNESVPLSELSAAISKLRAWLAHLICLFSRLYVPVVVAI